MNGIDKQRADAQRKEVVARAATAAALRAKAREEEAKKGLVAAVANLEATKAALELAFEMAKEAEEIAIIERRKADLLAAQIQIQLEELRNANTEKITGMLIQADRHLQKMEFDSVRHLCQAINSIPGGKERTGTILYETIFFYSESGQFEEAEDALRIAELQPTKTSRKEIAKLLNDQNPRAFDSLMTLYYPELVAVAGGYFLKGADWGRDLTAETIALEYRGVQNFSLGKTEVTNRQYYLFASQSKKTIPNKGNHLPNMPAASIRWPDAMEYLNWLSIQMGKTQVYQFKDSLYQNEDGQKDTLLLVKISQNADGFRLPTSTEWEYAGRGGQYSEQFRYAGSNYPARVAWIRGNSDRPQPVATLTPNNLGLYDMSGNVAEWCAENFDEIPEIEKKAWQKTTWKSFIKTKHPSQVRIYRPSSYKNIYGLAYESLGAKQDANADIGFRVAQSSLPLTNHTK
ncbi:MAG: formylglycine-generating enzyme family protein [Saprospiraceae bacterium]